MTASAPRDFTVRRPLELDSSCWSFVQKEDSVTFLDKLSFPRTSGIRSGFGAGGFSKSITSSYAALMPTCEPSRKDKNLNCAVPEWRGRNHLRSIV